MKSEEVILKMSGIGKKFSGSEALSGISLELKAGEVHALVGSNGAGKTTLMRILLGKVEPDAGTILCRGEEHRFHGLQELHREGIYIYDEPTAFMTPDREQLLFRMIRKLKADGCGILYISHRLDEVLSIADTVSVLRGGRIVSTRPAALCTRDFLIRDMAGSLGPGLPHFSGKADLSALRAEKLCGAILKDVNFVLNRGEILGVLGLPGSGQTELAQIAGGAACPRSGQLFRNGRKARYHSTRDAEESGVRYLNARGKSTEEVLRWLSRGGSVLILENADSAIFPKTAGYLERLAEEGKALMVLTDDSDALFSICSRLLLLTDGEAAGSIRLL